MGKMKTTKQVFYVEQRRLQRGMKDLEECGLKPNKKKQKIKKNPLIRKSKAIYKAVKIWKL